MISLMLRQPQQTSSRCDPTGPTPFAVPRSQMLPCCLSTGACDMDLWRDPSRHQVLGACIMRHASGHALARRFLTHVTCQAPIGLQGRAWLQETTSGTTDAEISRCHIAFEPFD